MSIAEVLVVASLFFGLLALVVLFFVRGNRLAVRSEMFGRVQNEAILLTRALSRDLYQSTWEWTQWDDGQLIFLSSRPLSANAGSEPAVEFESGTGRVIWKKWVAYILDDETGRVLRYEEPMSPPRADLTGVTSPFELADLSDLEQSQMRVVARQISSFVPEGLVGPNLVRFRVVARGELPLGNLSEDEKVIEVGMVTSIRLNQSTP